MSTGFSPVHTSNRSRPPSCRASAYNNFVFVECHIRIIVRMMPDAPMPCFFPRSVTAPSRLLTCRSTPHCPHRPDARARARLSPLSYACTDAAENARKGAPHTSAVLASAFTPCVFSFIPFVLNPSVSLYSIIREPLIPLTTFLHFHGSGVAALDKIWPSLGN
jgi:hypothetical protein